MLYIESIFNKALEIIANNNNSTVEAVKTCYEFDLYDMMARVREVYTELYNNKEVKVDHVEVTEDVDATDYVMTIEQAVKAKEEAIAAIDKKVLVVKGTWVKHKNLRNKLTTKHNEQINNEISEINKKIRSMIGKKEQDKRALYHSKTVLQLQVI